MSAAGSRCAVGVWERAVGETTPQTAPPHLLHHPPYPPAPVPACAASPKRRSGGAGCGVGWAGPLTPDFWMGHCVLLQISDGTWGTREAPDVLEGQKVAHPAGQSTPRASTGGPQIKSSTPVCRVGGAGAEPRYLPRFQSGVAGSLQVSSMSVWGLFVLHPRSRGFPYDLALGSPAPPPPRLRALEISSISRERQPPIVLVGQAEQSRRRPPSGSKPFLPAKRVRFRADGATGAGRSLQPRGEAPSFRGGPASRTLCAPRAPSPAEI